MTARILAVVAFAIGSSAQAGVSSQQTMTMTGCVGREVDVLRTSPGNLGLADEFVLIGASAKRVGTAGTPAAGRGATGGTTENAAATSGPYGRVYRLSGDREKELKDRVGQQVEITASFDSEADAKLEAAREAASAKAAGTPDRRPEAKDVPKMTIQSIHPLGTACSAPQRK